MVGGVYKQLTSRKPKASYVKERLKTKKRTQIESDNTTSLPFHTWVVDVGVWGLIQPPTIFLTTQSGKTISVLLETGERDHPKLIQY